MQQQQQQKASCVRAAAGFILNKIGSNIYEKSRKKTHFHTSTRDSLFSLQCIDQHRQREMQALKGKCHQQLNMKNKEAKVGYCTCVTVLFHGRIPCFFLLYSPFYSVFVCCVLCWLLVFFYDCCCWHISFSCLFFRFSIYIYRYIYKFFFSTQFICPLQAFLSLFLTTLSLSLS